MYKLFQLYVVIIYSKLKPPCQFTSVELPTANAPEALTQFVPWVLVQALFRVQLRLKAVNLRDGHSLILSLPENETSPPPPITGLGSLFVDLRE